MRYSNAIFLLASAFLIAGCGTLFHNRPNVEIIGPPGAIVENMAGDQLPILTDELWHGIQVDRGVFPDKFKTDSIKIVYGDQSANIALVKKWNGLEFLNIFSLGAGFVLDDLTDTWFNYAPVYIAVDSGTNGLAGIKATTSNNFGEPLGHKRPQFLLLCGSGVSFQMNGPSVFPFGGAKFPYPVVSLQLGIGVDFYKQFELFYLTRWEPFYSITNQPNGPTGSVTTQDICLRYFFNKSYFVQGSIGMSSIGGNTIFNNGYVYDQFGYQYYLPNTIYNNSFNEIGFAAGWAGDQSYVALQYFGGLTSFSVPEYSNIRYHTVYLTYGLNFRL